MEGNVVERHTGLVILWIKKIRECSRRIGRSRQSKSDKLHLRRDLEHRLRYGIVTFYVLLGAGVVFAIDFVVDLPVADLVVMAGGVEFSQLVREVTLCVPAR